MHRRAHTKTVSSKGLVAVMFLGAMGALVSACSSSSDGSAFGEFEGIWRAEFGTTADTESTFNLNCTTSMIARQDVLWDKLIFKPGTVSDLTETSGPSNCQFSFDVTGKTASVPAVDPVTGLASSCSVIIDSGTDPVTMDFIDLILEVKPTSWKFELITPVKGKPPTARLTGTSTGALAAFNETTMMVEGADNTCIYSIKMNVTKIANE